MTHLKPALTLLFLLIGPVFGTQAEQTTEPLWLDVRSSIEYKLGHVDGAVLLPHTRINAESTEELGNKDQKIYVYCRSGGRAGIAKKALQELGFTDVTNIGGLDAAKALHQANEQ